MTTTRTNDSRLTDDQGPTFYPYLDLPAEVQMVISQFLDRTTLRNLADTNKAQRLLLQHEIMRRFIESHHIIQVAGTVESSYFLTKEGFVYACGTNHDGQLGMGDCLARIRPVKVPGLFNIKIMVMCDTHPLFLSHSGLLWEIESKVVKRIELPLLASVKGFFSDERSAIALAQDGTVHARGLNTHYRLGINIAEGISHHLSFLSIPELRNIKHFITTAASALYLDEEGVAYAVGLNDFGQLALGDRMDRQLVATVPALSSGRRIVNFWSDGRVTFIQDENGDVFACGQNDVGQLGIGVKYEHCITPTLVSQLKDIKTIYIDRPNVYAITQHDQVLAWGPNQSGELGLGDQVSRLFPTLIPDLSSVVNMSFFEGKVLFHTRDGTTYVCGDRVNQLPGMESVERMSTKPIRVMEMRKIKQECTGTNVYTFSCHDGVVRGWGNNQRHVLGLEEEYYNTVEIITLPFVRKYIANASPSILLRYANSGIDYFHEFCFEVALLKLREMYTLDVVESVLPELKSDRCRQSQELSALFPGFELLQHGNNDVLHAYACLLIIYNELPHFLRADVDQQRHFVLMLKEMASPEKVEKRDRPRARQEEGSLEKKMAHCLKRYNMFADRLRTLPHNALHEAAVVLADRLPMPDLGVFKHKAEDELERDSDFKEKKPRF